MKIAVGCEWETKVFCAATASCPSEEVILASPACRVSGLKTRLEKLLSKLQVLHKRYRCGYVGTRFGILKNLPLLSLPQKVLELTAHRHTHSRSNFIFLLCV